MTFVCPDERSIHQNHVCIRGLNKVDERYCERCVMIWKRIMADGKKEE